MVIGSDRTKVVNKNIKLSDEDIKHFHYLNDKGIELIYQVVPTMEAEDFMLLMATVENK